MHHKFSEIFCYILLTSSHFLYIVDIPWKQHAQCFHKGLNQDSVQTVRPQHTCATLKGKGSEFPRCQERLFCHVQVTPTFYFP